MNAEIVSVGTELLLGQIVDTHAATTAKVLAECGIACNRRATVGDNLDRIVVVLREALSRADVVITIGGLGPTVDDLTRDAIASALNDPLVREPEVEERLRRFFLQRNLPWTDILARQADRPASGEMIENPNGTAPGLVCRKDGKVMIAMPGPKGEFEPMVNGSVRRLLAELHPGQVIHSRVLRVIGLGESHIETLIRDLMDGDNPSVAPYAHTGEVHLRLSARAPSVEAADAVIDPMDAEITRRLEGAVYGRDLVTLEQSILQVLLAKNETIGVAESMTGGQLAARLTSVPGASGAFSGGFVTYTVDSKIRLLDVPEGLLAEYGPVSELTAFAMADAALSRLGSTHALAITGNAGPTSDVDGKPVGLCYVAYSGPGGREVNAYQFRGIREDIQRRATQSALALLRSKVLEGTRRRSPA
jgi:nicotinamide-nucleotide amidase